MSCCCCVWNQTLNCSAELVSSVFGCTCLVFRSVSSLQWAADRDTRHLELKIHDSSSDVCCFIISAVNLLCFLSTVLSRVVSFCEDRGSGSSVALDDVSLLPSTCLRTCELTATQTWLVCHRATCLKMHICNFYKFNLSWIKRNSMSLHVSLPPVWTHAQRWTQNCEFAKK